MTKDTNGSGPELIVLGRDEEGKPQAARFPAATTAWWPRPPSHEPDRLQGRRRGFWLSLPRSCRLAGCTRLAVASCRR